MASNTLLLDGMRVRYKKGTKLASWSPSGHHYVVTITYADSQANFDYWGSANDKQREIEPEVYDMVQAIFSDAYMAYCYDDATDLMDEFGYSSKEARKVYMGISSTREKLEDIGFTESQILKMSTVADDKYELERSGVDYSPKSAQDRTLDYLMDPDAHVRPYSRVIRGTSWAIAVQKPIDFEITYCRIVTAWGEYSEKLDYWKKPIQLLDKDNCVLRHAPSIGELIEYTKNERETVDSLCTGRNNQENLRWHIVTWEKQE